MITIFNGLQDNLTKVDQIKFYAIFQKFLYSFRKYKIYYKIIKYFEIIQYDIMQNKIYI